MIIFSLGLAILPTWLLIRYFVGSDKYPEPPQLIKNVLAWRWYHCSGFISCFPSDFIVGKIC